MSLRDLFSRSNETDARTRVSKDKIICDTIELRELITKWAQNERWNFENFADFLQLIGVKLPVKLSEYHEEDCSFKCVTALNTEIRISLFFGDGFEHFSEIRIMEGNETRHYITNTNIGKRKCLPEVTLQSKIIKKNGKELKNYYYEYSCYRILKLDDTHVLKIEIDEPDKFDEKNEIFVLRNCSAIEEYLLKLDTSSLMITEVYEKIIELLDFSDKDISKSDNILFSYTETVGKEQKVLSKILLVKGEMQEYAILEKGETYHVFKNGNWKYLSNNGIKIFYHEETKQYIFSVAGSEQNIMTANPTEMMNRVKAKISKLWKFVK